MANILILSDRITYSSWQLALCLSDQQNEITYLTSFGENPENLNDHSNAKIPAPRPSNIQLLTFFKSWSFFEIAQILPTLFSIRPQILHFIAESDKISLNQAFLTAILRAFPRIIFSTSIFKIEKTMSRLNPIRYLIEQSDIVTCPSLDSLHFLKGLNCRNPRQGRAVLSPPMSYGMTSSASTSIEFSRGLNFNYLIDNSYVLIPLSKKSLFAKDKVNKSFNVISTCMKTHLALIVGSVSTLNFLSRRRFEYSLQKKTNASNWAITGTEPFELNFELLRNAKALVLAGQNFSPQELTKFYSIFLEINTLFCPLILDSHQAGIHPKLWRNGQNCWIVNLDHCELEIAQLLTRENLTLPLNIGQQSNLKKEAFDSMINELNRLYNRALRDTI